MIIVIAAATCFAAWRFRFPPNPPYTIEIRRVSADGSVTYEAQDYGEWNHEQNIAGLRSHSKDVIYHSIYADGLQFCFSNSGHVHAMAGNGNNLPSIYDRSWTWSGNPHDFPYFGYSKESPWVHP